MGLYVSSKLSEKSNKAIKKFVSKLPLKHKIKEDYYHCTLIYDKEFTEDKYRPSNLIDDCTAYPIMWDVFGTQESGFVLVLRIQSPELSERQAELIKAGAKNKFGEYKPHITVAVVEKDFDVSKLAIPTFELTFSHEYAKPLDEKYSYDPKSMCEGELGTFKQQLINESLFR